MAVSRPNGIINVLPGTYPISQQIAVNIPGITIKGQVGSTILFQNSVVPFLLNADNITLDGLTMTSDQAYPVEFIQVASDGD